MLKINYNLIKLKKYVYKYTFKYIFISTILNIKYLKYEF